MRKNTYINKSLLTSIRENDNNIITIGTKRKNMVYKGMINDKFQYVQHFSQFAQINILKINNK